MEFPFCHLHANQAQVRQSICAILNQINRIVSMGFYVDSNLRVIIV